MVGTIWQQAITWPSADQDLRHTMILGLSDDKYEIQGSDSIYRCHLISIGNAIVEIRRL